MFPYLFRIGPIFIAQIIFMTAGIIQVLITDFFPCYGYTFIELALQLFLIQIIISLKIIKKNKILRTNYISKLVFGKQQYYRKRIYWNFFSIFAVVVSLAYWMVRQGLKLSNSEMKDSQKIFTLYPLCFFSDYDNHFLSSQDLRMVLNFLYAANVILNLFVIALNIRSFYIYMQKIKKNRIFFMQNQVQSSQSLIDCQVINKSLSQSLITQQKDQKECGICLRKISGQQIIRLRCCHYFHKQCIIHWLQVKDQCPYRCL